MQCRHGCIANTAIFVSLAGIGYWLAEDPLPIRCTESTVLADALAFGSHNASVMVTLVLVSLSTLGIGGLLFFGLNGYVFGQMLAVLPPTTVPWVLLYAPVEVFAFLCANAWACCLSREATLWLRTGRQMRAIADARGLPSLAIGGIAIAAILEAWAVVLGWRDVC